jgi:hypothetical protein
MALQTPEATITYEVYLDGYRLIGTAEAELPNLQAMTAEVKGAGIAGQVDSPVIGHFQGMTCKLTFRTVTQDFMLLMQQQAHHIELWAAIQRMSVDTGKYVVQQQKIITRCIPKNMPMGKLGIGEVQGREMEFEVIYVREVVDGFDIYELDKYNGIFKVAGISAMQDVLKAIGLI